MIDYERETRNAYRSEERAADYKHYNTTAWSWARIATAFEQRVIRTILAGITWTPEDRILDIPCGAGILASALNDLPCRVVVSDVSRAMIAVGLPEYRIASMMGAVQGDITLVPFRPESFKAVIALGFLHRVPSDIRRAALREMATLSTKHVVVSCSVDTRSQRFKHYVLSRLRQKHVPAPHPSSLATILSECREAGLQPSRVFWILPFLSAEAVLLLEKDPRQK